MLPGVLVARLGTRVRALELRVGAGGSLSRRSNRREWAREVQDDALAIPTPVLIREYTPEGFAGGEQEIRVLRAESVGAVRSRAHGDPRTDSGVDGFVQFASGPSRAISSSILSERLETRVVRRPERVTADRPTFAFASKLPS
jgi:hypothetical protein